MSDLPQLPFAQTAVLDPPPVLLELQAEGPVVRVRTQAGDEAWLVTRYEQVRELFADPRLGRSHPNPDQAARVSNSVLMGTAVADDNEDENHALMRAMLMPAFSPRRMRAMRPHIQEIIDVVIDGMLADGGPVDLHERLSMPLPVLVICALLGVPYEDRDDFRAWSNALGDTVDGTRSAAGWENLTTYMKGLIGRKRTEPGDDLISDLIAEYGDQVRDDDLAMLSSGLLFAGHETTMVRIDIGTVLFLTNPSQRAAFLRDEKLAAAAIEEVLRRSVTGGGGLLRYAREDMDIAGTKVHAGEAVLLAAAAANHDERAFVEAVQFDIARPTNQHLSFGHGARYCIGANLARVELQLVFDALLRRIPTLRLAVPVEDLQLRVNQLGGGLVSVPVTW
ncbi:cytochrome P450 [Kutzneria sp. CA-103260]|uniref:cytochrome P450 n=1 Tax=Kutzneria sp. CA-103260 TaxID=2802641 RepID=UPI001BA4D199|nr:cytochrome P450 [Kutzneria sp. CA-103260]QUQ68179.1 cytochrome P450 [Kutzneria sp. CA-103260]